MGDGRLYYRPWDDLPSDTLGLIFRKLRLDEILNVVPGVCKTWADVVRGPYCWQEIDIEDWSRYRRAESIDRMLLLLLSRSSGSLQKLCVCGLSTSVGLSSIADKSPLQLDFPRLELLYRTRSPSSHGVWKALQVPDSHEEKHVSLGSTSVPETHETTMKPLPSLPRCQTSTALAAIGRMAAWDEFLNLPSSSFGFAFDEMDYDRYLNDSDSDNEANSRIEELGVLFFDDESDMDDFGAILDDWYESLQIGPFSATLW